MINSSKLNQGIQVRNENNLDGLATFNLNKNLIYIHILNTHTHTCSVVRLYHNSTRILLMGVKICEDCGNHWRSKFYFMKNSSSLSSDSFINHHI